GRCRAWFLVDSALPAWHLGGRHRHRRQEMSKTRIVLFALAAAVVATLSPGAPPRLGPHAAAGPSVSDAGVEQQAPLAGTKPLTMKGDIASELVAGVDRFLLKEIEKSVARRARFWKRDFSSADAYNQSIEANRMRLAHILGVRD